MIIVIEPNRETSVGSHPFVDHCIPVRKRLTEKSHAEHKLGWFTCNASLEGVEPM